MGSNALLSSSPSLIWLQLGFGLARAVTIQFIFALILHIHYYTGVVVMSVQFHEVKTV